MVFAGSQAAQKRVELGQEKWQKTVKKFLVLEMGDVWKVSLIFSSGSNFTDPYQIPEKKWGDDPTKLPKVNFPQVYTYLIDSPGLFTKKLQAYKV